MTDAHGHCSTRRRLFASGGSAMNWDRIQGEWKQVTGQIKSKWAKLTDEDLTSISAKKDKLVGKIQERYGILRDEAERQVDEWLAKMPSRHDGGRGDTPRDTSKR
jgi:uncharacterized protein YjbJ (UPF0337 family)